MAREGRVVGRDAGARVDQEQHHVGHGDGALGLGAHAPLQQFRGRILQSCRVDQREVEIGDRALALAPVARHAGPVMDQRRGTPDQTIEERGLAHVGTPDDGDREGHDGFAGLRPGQR